MSRALYALVIALHPPAFRARFEGEMLLTFEDARVTEGSGRLLFDALRSLLRQWLIREGLWVYPVALAGAASLVSLIGWGRTAIFERHTPRDSSEALFLLIAVMAIMAVLFTTIFCVVWLRIVQRLRRA
jgi:hypothetical protein